VRPWPKVARLRRPHRVKLAEHPERAGQVSANRSGARLQSWSWASGFRTTVLRRALQGVGRARQCGFEGCDLAGNRGNFYAPEFPKIIVWQC